MFYTIYESSSGILRKKFENRETDPIYKGNFENGRPNGVGLLLSLIEESILVEIRMGIQMLKRQWLDLMD